MTTASRQGATAGVLADIETAVLEGGLAPDDVLDRLLPLMRSVAEAHEDGLVADLDGVRTVAVDTSGRWALAAPPVPPRTSAARLRRVDRAGGSAMHVVGRGTLEVAIGAGAATYDDHAVLADGADVEFPVHVPGYRTWEGRLGHADALVDVFVLGELLASLACGLDLQDRDDHAAFVASRADLFALAPDLNPVLARTVREMTELDRHRRAPDLRDLVRRLETYRDQPDDFDLGQLAGFAAAAPGRRRELVLEHLRDRLFDPTRRNRLLHFRATQQTVDLTLASVPHLLDHERIRTDQLLTWQPAVASALEHGRALKLSSALRFEDNPYLPGALDRIRGQAKKDRAEYGFAQLRLVLSFLRWHDLRGAATEIVDSPLLLLPVELAKKKGVRDSFVLQPGATHAEVNPSLRHRLAELYALRLPEQVEVSERAVAEFHRDLVAQVQASEPGVAVQMVDRPRIELVQRQARLRAEMFLRRRAGAAARARAGTDVSHSYRREDYRPRGLQLFLERVRPAALPQRVTAGGRADELRAPAAVAAAEPGARNQGTYTLTQARSHGNPYEWEIDLCRLTLGNFNYRRMSLVQDYERLLRSTGVPSSFDEVFGVEGRQLDEPVAPLATGEQHLVVDSDSTQLRAVARARAGSSYIVQGPPGTGKSQTITNLIADFVAQGKRVLFVCEKRAAVDVVYARLRRSGLESLCCLIHDSQADKRAFVHDLRATYEAHLAAADGAGHGAEERRSALVDQIDAELEALHRLTVAMSSQVPGTDTDAVALLDELAALQGGRTADVTAALDPEQLELLPTLTGWRTAAGSARRLERALADVGEERLVSAHPVALLGDDVLLSDRPQRAAGALLQRARRQLDDLERELDRAGLPVDVVGDLPQLLDLSAVVADALAPLAERELLPALDPASGTGRALDELVTQHRAAAVRAEQSSAAAAAWRDGPALDEAEELLVAARRFEGSALAGFRRRWRHARRLVAEQYAADAPSVTAALELLVDERRAVAAVEELEERCSVDFGTRKVGDLAGQVEAARRLRGSSVRSVASAVSRPAEPGLAALLEGVRAVTVDLHSLARTLGELLRNPAGIGGGVREVRVLLDALDAELDLLPSLLDPLRALAEADPAAVHALTTLPLSVEDLELACGQRARDRWLSQDRGLARLDGPAVERRVAAVAALRREFLDANAEVIRARVRARFLDHVRRSGLPAAQLDAAGKAFKQVYRAGRRELEHEFGKVMRYKSIRDLAGGAAGQVVADLKPVWLMSPLSVSDTLPLQADLFDVVIFDEASQVPVEDAVPALHRAPQVIVVGDRMQLPPTSFFSAADADPDADQLVVEEDGEAVTVSLDGTSFLNQSATHLSSVLLAWHYRSRSEALIGFSNAAFYGGELRTVPDRVARSGTRPQVLVGTPGDGPTGGEAVLDRPISFHLLPHGVYDSRRNLAEAEHVAELVRDLLLRETGRSIGVVAFSEAQQSAIEEALARLAADDPDFAARLEREADREEDDQHVGLFVKNLENVQGDERDIVVLSICYAPDPRGRMRMNFGPINAADGEKRLNVIFSRAKHHMAVVSSIRSDAITNDWNDGAQALKGFLRYAEASSLGQDETAAAVLEGWLPRAARVLTGTAVVVEQLAAALRSSGCLVETDLGTSQLRCDLAVRLPGDAEHALAVLLDHRRDSTRDDHERYVDRPRAFAASGWSTAHVLANDWLSDPDAVVQRLLLQLGAGPSTSSPPGPQAPAAADLEPPDAVRRLECHTGGAAKFWEVRRDGTSVTVRFGRLGSRGQTQVKDLGTSEAAAARVDRLVREKLAKGYVESP